MWFSWSKKAVIIPPSRFSSFNITMFLIISCALELFFVLKLKSIILLSSFSVDVDLIFCFKVVLIILMFFFFLTPFYIFSSISVNDLLLFWLSIHNYRDLDLDGRVCKTFVGCKGLYSSSILNRSWSENASVSYCNLRRFIFEKVQSSLAPFLLALIPETFVSKGIGLVLWLKSPVIIHRESGFKCWKWSIVSWSSIKYFLVLKFEYGTYTFTIYSSKCYYTPRTQIISTLSFKGKI